MAFFKPGDKVTVRRDLIRDRQYYMNDSATCDSVVDAMMSMRGKTVTIRDYPSCKYTIEECGFNWTDEMFEEFVNRNAEPLETGRAASPDDIISMLYRGSCV